MGVTRTRQVVAAIVTAMLVLVVWKFIDWRTTPPPPPSQAPAAPVKP